MSRIDDQLTEQFYRWELRGRGWQIFEQPVGLEPPFLPFAGQFLPPQKRSDEGRRHTRLSGFMERLRQTAAPPPPAEATEADTEPEPEWRGPEELEELQMSLPLSRSVPTPQVESFLRHVCRASETLVLEILGTERETVPQFVASPRAVMRVQRAVEACFPGVVVTPAGEALSEAWRDSEASFAVAELGLGSEFMLPLRNPHGDLLAAVVTGMELLEKEELALFQVLVEPVRNPWGESVIRAVTNGEGGPFFANRPELVRAAQQKMAAPLFGVVIRLAASAAHMERAWEIIADMAAPLSALARPGSNYFVPLANDGYPPVAHEQDILNRQTRRSGMLLNMEELMPLLTLPTTSTSRKLRRETKRTHAAPDMLTGGGGFFLGNNTHAGTTREVLLSAEHRVRHTHVIGASGTGKSTLLLNLIQQDIDRGEGVAVFDPHGDLVDTILGVIPPKRREDVIVLDPSDEGHSVGLNILAAHSDFERGLLASDLTSVFRRLSTSWGDQMESVLRNGILAFLESTRGGTLADLRRFLLDAGFRKEFLRTVTDPEIVYYWTKAFPQLSGGKSIGPLLTRLDEFLSRKPIRYMVSQSENRIDFAEILDRGRILLVKLPQGLIGRENTALLGSLITAKLQMAAMSRQRMPAAQRRDFWCYMDEFQHFITPSMAEILAGARKYRLGLILAHQELRHLEADRDVASAVLSNCYTRVVFKVGDADARSLENGFSHFEARDLMNLGIGEAVCRVERSDFDFNLTVPKPEPSDEDDAMQVREEVIAISRAKYARPRSEIEAELLRQWQTDAPEKPRPAPTPPTTPEPPKVSETAPISEEPKGSEKPVAPAPETVTAETTVAEPKAPRALPTLGRGGATHKDLQILIKAQAEDLGFRATLEESVPTGDGSVDVGLERGRLTLGCEISVTTGTTSEVGNVLKCLRANFAHIAFISSNEGRVQEVSAAVREKVSTGEFARIGFYSPDEFFAYLKKLAEENPEEPELPAKPGVTKTKKKRGWTLKSETAQLTPEEAKQADERGMRAIAEALRKKKPEA
jgi:hypothetical protein